MCATLLLLSTAAAALAAVAAAVAGDTLVLSSSTTCLGRFLLHGRADLAGGTKSSCVSSTKSDCWDKACASNWSPYSCRASRRTLRSKLHRNKNSISSLLSSSSGSPPTYFLCKQQSWVYDAHSPIATYSWGLLWRSVCLDKIHRMWILKLLRCCERTMDQLELFTRSTRCARMCYLVISSRCMLSEHRANRPRRNFAIRSK